MRKLKKAVGTLLLLAGLFIFLAPDLYRMYTCANARAEIDAFRRTYGISGKSGMQSGQSRDDRTGKESRIAQNDQDGNESKTVNEDQNESRMANNGQAGNEDRIYGDNLAGKDSGNQLGLEGLRESIEIYNTTIFQEHQAQLCDAWSYEQNPFSVEMPDDLFGYIEIPAMEVTLPLYLGATGENMARGAAILGQSSLPVDGSDTNSVIAGHRGYRGAPYFREIEKLQPGDEVRVTNPWETLSYTVEDMVVIDPSDIDAVLIQPGKEMLTLITCHPYMGHGKYRYVVYCSRMDGEKGAVSAELTDGFKKQGKQPDQREQYEENNQGSKDRQGILSSAQLVFFEQILRRAGAVVILMMLICVLRKKSSFKMEY